MTELLPTRRKTARSQQSQFKLWRFTKSLGAMCHIKVEKAFTTYRSRQLACKIAIIYAESKTMCLLKIGECRTGWDNRCSLVYQTLYIYVLEIFKYNPLVIRVMLGCIHNFICELFWCCLKSYIIFLLFMDWYVLLQNIGPLANSEYFLAPE